VFNVTSGVYPARRARDDNAQLLRVRRRADLGLESGPDRSLLAYTGLSGELVMEPGPVELSAGSSSSDIRATAKVMVTGKMRSINGEERAFLSVATVGS
jgi:hypothetical protein